MQLIYVILLDAGIVKTWVPHDKYLSNSLRVLLTRFLDITIPPTPNLLRYFASIAKNAQEQTRLNLLASVCIQFPNGVYNLLLVRNFYLSKYIVILLGFCNL